MPNFFLLKVFSSLLKQSGNFFGFCTYNLYQLCCALYYSSVTGADFSEGAFLYVKELQKYEFSKKMASRHNTNI